MKIKILIIASACLSTSAFAGGYRVALQGQNAAGMGHTGVALTDSAEVVFFNPAGMSFLAENNNFIAGLTLVNSKTKFQNVTSNVAAETDNPIGMPFNIYYTRKHNEKISYGLGIYTPYGNSVEWEKDWAGSHVVNDIMLRAIYVQPTVSYKFNDKYSVGFGPVYANGAVDFNRNLSSALVDENGDRANVTVKGSNIHAWGYNIGFLAQPIKPLSLGISYRSKIDMKARDEKADFENIPSSMQAGYADTTFDADMVLPAELTLGASYVVNASTVLAFDINRTFWGAYDKLDVKFNNSAPPSLNPRNFSDANIFRVGVQHKATNTLTIRGGAYFDDSPISDGYYVPETARNDSIGLTLGASYQVSKRLGVDLSFLYLMFDEFKGSFDFVGHDTDPSTQDSSFGGEYKTSVTAFGFGLNYKY